MMKIDNINKKYKQYQEITKNKNTKVYFLLLQSVKNISIVTYIMQKVTKCITFLNLKNYVTICRFISTKKIIIMYNIVKECKLEKFNLKKH